MLTPEEYTQLKSTEMEILCKFDAFCREHGLQYYLIGGALLGAARYGGFIPWDDDVDVAMPRQDYERLQQLWDNDMDGAYYLQSGKTDPKFSRCILKLRKNNTKIVERGSEGLSMHSGIYIDIFPIDYLATPPGIRVALRAARVRRLMSLRAIKNGYEYGCHVKVKRVLRFFFRLASNKQIDRAINRLCTRENGGRQDYAILFLHNYPWHRQMHEIEVLGAGKACLFEGQEFMAPKDMERFLSRVFGPDYMREPPEEKRKPPHQYLSVEF